MKLIIGVAIVIVAAVGAAQMLGPEQTAAAAKQATGIATDAAGGAAANKLAEVAETHELALPDGVAAQIHQIVTSADIPIDPYSWCAGYRAATGVDPQDCQTQKLWAEPADR